MVRSQAEQELAPMRLENNFGTGASSRIVHPEHSFPAEDQHVAQARREVAQLLTIAYIRLARILRAPGISAGNLTQGALALSGDQSVHECD